ncbi:MAG TPA: YggS family pyridoxal phosphate-dependent enzyme [Bacillota bacterium]|nr:YggS family pyridoxal phosphate-dependent enzyme [Bacillota bacterium]
MNRKDFIEQNIRRVRAGIEEAAVRTGRDTAGVKLIAVSKNFPAEDVAIAYRCGLKSFGENRVQELMEKKGRVSDAGIEADWHLIGTLQRNKARFVTGQVSLIHSVDSERLMRTIEMLAAKAGIVQDILLQVNVSGELTKQGFEPAETEEILRRTGELDHIRVCGLMTMAPYYENPDKARHVFGGLRALRDRLAALGIAGELPELSMGMSNDFIQAINEGATIVRVGSAIFGERVY